jgi:hypothetical protein
LFEGGQAVADGQGLDGELSYECGAGNFAGHFDALGLSAGDCHVGETFRLAQFGCFAQVLDDLDAANASNLARRD